MILTGKAKNDFEMWLLKDGNEIIKNGSIEYDLYYMCKYMIPESMVYSKIIDWFDSIGIYISIINKFDDGIYFIYSIYNSKKSIKLLSKELEHYLNRNAAKKNAIIKANEIYNNKKS